jgi:hypothetical protein
MELSRTGAPARRKPFSDSSFLIVGLVRNCARQLATDVDRMASAFDGAKSLQWLLIESDSTDGTLDVLAGLKGRIRDFNFLPLGTLRERLPLRTERIAHCRNRYVEEIRHNPAYWDVDYVVVSDFDGLNSHLTAASVRSCWDRDDWDICTANQDGPYYDIWALRHETWSPNDCYEQLKFLNRFNADTERNLYSAVHSRMIRIPVDSEWIEVDSAFGGLAIYPRKAFEESSYIGLNSAGEEICEHVTFHKILREQGYRIAINPKMINAAYTEHSERLFLSIRAKRKLQSLLRRGFDTAIGRSVNALRKIIGAGA